jgi:hypothetical protein
LRVASPTDAATALAALEGARDIQTNGAYVNVSGLPSEEVVKYLVSHSIIPSEVSAGQNDLESLFLELTQETDTRKE